MWVKDDNRPLNMNLNEILATMTENQAYRMGPKMLAALREAEQEAEQAKSARRSARAAAA